MVDKRAHTRFPLSIDVTLSWDGKSYPAKSRDISLGGMFVYCEAQPAYNSEVVLRFTIPGLKDQSVVQANVRWPFPGGLGMSFKSMRAIEVWALNQLFKKRA